MDNSWIGTKKFIIAFGIISILICVTTWGIDIAKVVGPCVYCRTERTIIGLIGLLMLLPKYRLITLYLATTLGFFGAHVASAQVFSHLVENLYEYSFALAAAALFVIIAQIIALLIYFQKHSDPHSQERI